MSVHAFFRRRAAPVAEAPAAAPDARELHLAAASEVEREGWIMMLHKATKVLQKASGASPPPKKKSGFLKRLGR